MLPFNNIGHNQFASDRYSPSGYFGNQLYFIPQDHAQLFNPLRQNQNQEFPFQTPFATDFPPFLEDCPVKIEQRETKPTEGKDDNESSVSVNNLDDSSDHSPQLRFKQKYGRNINSNIFHHMLRRLISEKDLGRIIKKVIQREGSILNEKEFMEFLNRKYFKKMTKMFKGQKYRNRIYQETLLKQKQFCKIFRIVSRYYLKNVHLLHVYNILKIKRQSKRLHVTGSRRILELMEHS